MITAWMAYAVLVGAFAAGSAWVLERFLRSHRHPVRWLWLGGMALSGLWPVWTALRPRAEPLVSGLPPDPSLFALEPLTLQVGRTSLWVTLDRPLVAFWALSSFALFLLGIGLLVRTRRLRARWRGEKAAGRDVLISEDWGPAVVGLLKPQIVLPRWCHNMDAEGLRLILDHEAEHLEAGDLRVLVLAGLFPVLFPWSLPSWWMWHRLRLAVEGDCDLRVLRRNPRATRAYLALLLEVGRRLPQGRVAAAMLSEPERTLARRIRTMTMPIPKKPLLRGILLVAAGAVLIAVACAVPTPTALDDDAGLPAVEAVVEEDAGALSDQARELLAGPALTPFTVRPDIKNRREVAASLEREYPPLLRDAGIGGTVNVWFFLDEAGLVRRTVVNVSSGHPALDDAALKVADGIEFTPALNRDRAVPVWIALPITFTTREAGDAAREPRYTFPLPPEPGADPGSERSPQADATSPRSTEEIGEAPTFTPFTVRPDITNREAVASAMEREYPPLLRDAGVGGTVDVWVFLDEAGVVRKVLLNRSSGHDALDEAALGVARQIEFTPAMNRDKRVPVWISLPISFTAR